jgi:tRNA (cytidine56-2'-O)-methyltransferase
MLTVLRMNHRRFRDNRLTTHCGLASRALGADGIILSGEKDAKLEESIKKVVDNWGGDFSVSYEKDWKKVMKSWSGVSVHLTMYGLPIQEKIEEIRKHKDVLLIIGSEKVQADAYQLATYNIAVTSQPHSEVAALSIFLHEYFRGKELDKQFKGKINVVPQERGKKTLPG